MTMMIITAIWFKELSSKIKNHITIYFWLVLAYHTIRCHAPKDHNMNHHRLGNFTNELPTYDLYGDF
jgi:hypothetical protein